MTVEDKIRANWEEEVRHELELQFKHDSTPPKRSAPARTGINRPLPLSIRIERLRYWRKFQGELDEETDAETFERVSALLHMFRFKELEDARGRAVPPPRKKRRLSGIGLPVVHQVELDARVNYWKTFLAESESLGEYAVAAEVRAKVARITNPVAHDADPKAAIGAAKVFLTEWRSPASAHALVAHAAFRQSLVDWAGRIQYWRGILEDIAIGTEMRERVETLIELLEGRSKRPVVGAVGPRKQQAVTIGSAFPVARRSEYWNEFLISAEAGRAELWFEQASVLKDTLEELDHDPASTPLDVLSQLVARFRAAWDVPSDESRRPAALKALEDLVEMRLREGAIERARCLTHNLGSAVDWFESGDEYTDIGLFESLPLGVKRAFADFQNCRVLIAEPKFYPDLLFATFQDRRNANTPVKTFAFDAADKMPPYQLSGSLLEVYDLNKKTALDLSPQTARRYLAMAVDFAIYQELRSEDAVSVTNLDMKEEAKGFRFDVEIHDKDKSLRLELRLERESGRVSLVSTK